MNNMTLEAKPSNRPSPPGGEIVDKANDHSVALHAKPAFNKITSQSSADKFEQARLAFFSK